MKRTDCAPAGGVIAAMCLAGSSISAELPLEGVTVNLVTRLGPLAAQRLAERGEEFTAKTGALIVITEVPFAELFQTALTDRGSRANSFDAAVFGSGWGPESIAAGLVENLAPHTAKDEVIDFDDGAPYFRDHNQVIGGSTDMIAVDGDFQMLCYRADLPKADSLEPPRTWDEYMALAGAVRGQDMNGDGEAGFGFCWFKRRCAQFDYTIGSIAAGFVQTKGTGEGIFFHPAAMQPRVAGRDAAFRIHEATGEFGPPDELNHDMGDTRSLMTAGRCALTKGWGDTGALAIDLGAEAVRDRAGAAITPGTKLVFHTEHRSLEQCTAALCPNAAEGENHAPFAACGGWLGAVNAESDAKPKRDADEFLRYMSQPGRPNVDVTVGRAGFNPCRNSHLGDPADWITAGYSSAFADNCLGAIKRSLNQQNMVSDIRIPGATNDKAVILRRELSRCLEGGISVEDATHNIEQAWNRMTEDFDRQRQAELYRLSLGMTN